VFYGLNPPLGLLYLARILEDQGDTVRILDFSAEPYDPQKITRALSGADAVGVTLLSPALEQGKQIISAIKQEQPDLPVIIGGPHCTLLPGTVLQETKADISVQGDAETLITDLRSALLKEKPLAEIPGVSIRRNDNIIHGPPAEPQKNLDTIPFPARHLLKHLVYGREYNPRLNAGEFTSIITSRGCPYSCRFCSRGSVSMHHYQTRSPDNILAELRDIQQQGYRHVTFVDDCFPVNINHALTLFEGIINESLNLKFTITASRVDLADETLYKKMKQAGVAHIQFGLESGNQDVLDYFQKHTTVEAIRKAVHLSHDTGFFTIGSFIFGAPFETTEHFKKTLRFACSLPLNSASFLPLRYMVGSDLWNEAVAAGRIQSTEYCVTADKNRGLGLFTRQELLAHCQHAQTTFYTRPRFILQLLRDSFRNNDMSFVHAHLSSFISSFK
jgi:anaerobic magnesium-protoporphyrin IX monomethyl ester cyclase